MPILAAAVAFAAGCDWLSPGGGSASFAIEPSELDLRADQGDTTPLQDTVRLTFRGPGTVSWTASSDQAWLTVSPSGGSIAATTTGATLLISADPTGLGAGAYTATVTASDVTGGVKPACLTVNLLIDPPQGTLSFTPAQLNFGAVEGDTTSLQGAAALGFEGTGVVSWTAASDQPWLTAGPASGAVGQADPIDLTVTADPTGLATGRHTGHVTVSDTGGHVADAVLTVVFDVTPRGPEGTLSFTPTQLSFQAFEGDTVPLQDTATLSFVGTGTVTWTAVSDQIWLTTEPSSGTVDDLTPGLLTITVDPSGLALGQHTAHATASDSGGVVADAVLTVILYVDPPPEIVLQAEPRLARLHALSGDATPSETTIALSVTGGTDIGWEAAPAEAWLGVSPATGTISEGSEAQVVLTVDPASLGLGLHVTALTFSTPGGEAENVEITVSFALRSETAGSSGLVYYVSEIDRSPQPYGIYLPAGFVPGSGSPVAVCMHGYGGHASSTFSATKTPKADAAGMILVNLEGRGSHQYDGAAETDLFEVLADVDAAYKIDWSRVFLEGCSMGGTGSFRFIARHPDVFAGAGGVDGWTDHRLWHAEWYAPAAPDNWWVHPAHVGNLEQASPLTHAENVLAGSLFMRVDTDDIAVYSEGDPKLHARLDRLLTAHDYGENAGGHCAAYSPNVANIYDFFLSRAPLDLDPAGVRIRSNRLRTAKHAWFGIERFAWNGWAEVTGTRTVNAGTCTFEFATRNVRRFTIASPPGGETVSRHVVIAGGVTCLDEAAGAVSFPLVIELTLDAAASVTSGGVYVPPATPALEKRPRLEGPVMRALTESFTVAYGTAHADQAVNDGNRAEARKFCDFWADVWNDSQYGFGAIWDEAALSGTLAFTKDSATVTGTGTVFRSQLGADDLVRVSTSSSWYRVADVKSDTEIELTGTFFHDTVSAPGFAASTVAPVDEKDLTPADLASANLVIFGTEESSVLVADMAGSPEAPFHMPARVLEDQITLAGEVFAIPHHGLWMVYPNPLAPARLVVLGHNVIGETPGLYDMIFWTHDSWSWRWPEYVVFDTSKPVRGEVTSGEQYTADQYVEWGFFDQDWTPTGAADPRTVVTVATDAATYTYGTATATVTVTVEDEAAVLVTGLGPSAFEVRIDGEFRACTFVETATPGVYEADVTISDLIVAGYDITVEVVRPDAGGPPVGLVAGTGRARFGVQ